MRKIYTVLLTIIMIMSLIGCGTKKEDITGKWQDEDGDEIIELFSDGTGTITTDDITYSMEWITENDRIKMTVNFGLLGEYVLTYDYKISGDSFTLTNDDGEEATYLKQ